MEPRQLRDVAEGQLDSQDQGVIWSICTMFSGDFIVGGSYLLPLMCLFVFLNHFPTINTLR